MGFPVGYTELLLPRLFLHALSILGHVRKLILLIFRLLGLPDFLEPEVAWPDPPVSAQEPDPNSPAAMFAGEILPVVRFSDLALLPDLPESCAVCLFEFESDDEIRRLTNCRHIFHRSCLDRWMMGYHQMTCPLCRTPFIPDELQEAFNQKVWAESGVPEPFGELVMAN